MQTGGTERRPAPTLSRRHAAGSASARGLLFTALGEFVLPAGGTAWTASFIDLLGRLGVEEKATRQALMRTASDGWLGSERVGRRTCWALTPCSCATSAKAGCLVASSLASPRPPSGLHGRNARPSSSQTSISGRLLRKAGENWFCTLTSASPRAACAARICSGLALEMPSIRTLPDAAISFIVPRTSS